MSHRRWSDSSKIWTSWGMICNNDQKLGAGTFREFTKVVGLQESGELIFSVFWVQDAVWTALYAHYTEQHHEAVANGALLSPACT